MKSGKNLSPSMRKECEDFTIRRIFFATVTPLRFNGSIPVAPSEIHRDIFMPLLSLQNVSLGFGGPLLLDGVDLSIEPGERVCLVGRNGTGKSTILKLITGDVSPESGKIVFQQGLRVARLAQEVPQHVRGTVFDVVASGVGEQGALLAEYHHASGRLARDHSDERMAELEDVQHRLETAGGWELNRMAETVLMRLGLPADHEFGSLSGGLKRRVLLAKALSGNPDLLLLDEPTNHLDIDAIAWLEEFLFEFRGALLFVTHDRTLLRKLATRIVDLDRGRLTSWPGNYDTYLERKQAALDAESAENVRFDKRLLAEEVWIRQGIKARRTRNEGRVRALMELRKDRAARKERTGSAMMRIEEADRTGKLVLEAKDVGFAYGTQMIVSGFSTTILRSDKVGIVGRNGSGKTTLLKLLLGELAPQNGTVKRGTNLEVVYLDQLRAVLDDEKTVMDNVANGSDYVTVGGANRHVIGYLQDFLFSPDRARSPVKVLSGGERNRLLLARLFAKPSNVLVLDEPTNDLDLETLELLEELVMDYSGTVLVVSHDRSFLNNVATSTLVFEDKAKVNEYVGGYDDWMRQRRLAAPVEKEKPATRQEKPRTPKEKPRKLSFKEQKELDALPQRIEELEAEQHRLHGDMADPKFYRESGSSVSSVKARLEVLEKELAEAYKRWEELEALRV
jgi:ATP-binding cassette subfamily F protein uup